MQERVDVWGVGVGVGVGRTQCVLLGYTRAVCVLHTGYTGCGVCVTHVLSALLMDGD